MNSKAHAVCIPYPSQSHIKAMLKLAKILHDKGIYITFVNTEYNHNRFLKSGGLSLLLGLQDFKFETIPDSLPPSDSEGTQDLEALCVSVTVNFLSPFVNLVEKLELSSPEIPPVSCIVSDGFMWFTLDAGERLAIPVVFLWTLSASGFMGFYQIQKLMDKGLIPLKDESCLTEEFLNTIVDWVPGEDFFRFKDLPSFARTTNIDEIIFKFTSDASQRSRRASANILHTFRELEPSVFNFLSSIFSKLYTIGPLELLQKNENDVTSNGYSLWKEEPQCIEWLNTKKPNSVIYVNFGSIAALPATKMTEFFLGLANSDQNFLFIIRKDAVEGKTGILPPEFFEMIKERGFIASWCQQEDVVNHPSVGGFLTHCGWNSVIESLSAGVPMICLPFFGDQMTNCRYICTEWEVGIELDMDFDRVSVEKVVRELIEGENGEKMRNKAKEWKKIAKEVCSENGSSSLNLDKLVSDFFCHK